MEFGALVRFETAPTCESVRTRYLLSFFRPLVVEKGYGMSIGGSDSIDYKEMEKFIK